jgi:hypothetical protein
VLTIAASEGDAVIKQRFAERICASLKVRADFDSVVTADSRSAIARIAKWRSCSHVFFERSKTAASGPRRQRRRDYDFDDLKELSGLVTLVALPENMLLDFPNEVHESSAVRPWGRKQPCAGGLAQSRDHYLTGRT